MSRRRIDYGTIDRRRRLPITSVGICDAMGNNYGCADVVFADNVENALTVDAEPVQYGKWIFVGTGYSYCFECSNCGAKMKEDKNQNE